MEHDLLETTTPERCVLEVARPRFFTMLTGPDQLTTDSRNTPPRTFHHANRTRPINHVLPEHTPKDESDYLIPWQRFCTLLQQRFAHLGRRWIGVCSNRSSNQGLCVSHVGAVVV